MGAGTRPLALLAFAALLFCATGEAFYITPGFLSPTAFRDNETVPLMVNKLTWVRRSGRLLQLVEIELVI
jgi:hypothetical protein